MLIDDTLQRIFKSKSDEIETVIRFVRAITEVSMSCTVYRHIFSFGQLQQHLTFT